MNSGKILANDPEREKLCPRKDRDDRSQEWKPRHAATRNQKPSHDEKQHQQTDEREGEADQTRELERQRAESSHHIQRVNDEFAQRVVGGTSGARFVSNDQRRETAGRPG